MHFFVSPKHLLIITTFLLNQALVSGGWNPPLEPPLDPIDNDGNDTHSTGLNRRWYSVRPGTTPLVPIPWPGATIPYCYKNQNSRTQLSGFVSEGWKAWVAAGIANQRIHWGEYNNCPPPDATSGDVPYGQTYVIIEALSTGTAASTVGNQIGSNYLKLNPANTVGTGNTVSNMAHEIGHVLGLFHEHQKPEFWSAEYVGGKGATNQITFTCSALRDYSDPNYANDPRRAQACKDTSVAKTIGFFGAQEYLPRYEGAYSDSDGTDFDWQSIMLYGSSVGGVTDPTTNPPTKENVYFRNNPMGVVPPNFNPSITDALRVNEIYPADAPYPNPCLINQVCNPLAYELYKLKCKMTSSTSKVARGADFLTS